LNLDTIEYQVPSHSFLGRL